ncbi:hypothetical protein CASFOL_030181 [Castilleja foliolosa]|uniref:Eukaryotic peptide chain release factor GTP-binding subunit n=1 Tax=Castilleja foliolosa TaxID=1961234 RepID=A0ABD3CAM9_9LAMI
MAAFFHPTPISPAVVVRFPSEKCTFRPISATPFVRFPAEKYTFRPITATPFVRFPAEKYTFRPITATPFLRFPTTPCPEFHLRAITPNTKTEAHRHEDCAGGGDDTVPGGDDDLPEGKGFKCPECDSDYSSSEQRTRHIEKHHPDLFKKNIKCKMCHLYFPSKVALRKHTCPLATQTETEYQQKIDARNAQKANSQKADPKGTEVEVGRAYFETETSRFTILDAPGHKSYVPNMISGASQADVGVLVISARRGEFETSYERGGQTRKHVQLAKTLGVTKLIVVVNKMDDPTVQWSKERFDEIKSKIATFVKSSGYNVKKDVQFLPISGLMGTNMKTRMSKSVCPWWNGPCLFEVLDAIGIPSRDPNGPFRMPIIDKFKDMGTVIMGKIESGSIREGDNMLIMPNKAQVIVLAIYCDEDKVWRAGPGENVRVRLSGIEEEDIIEGFVLCSVVRPIPAVSEFVAQLQILELLDNAIFCAGYKAILHIHAVVEECEIVELIEQIDPKTRKRMKKKPLFVKNNALVGCRVQVNNLICIEKFSDFARLGRFTLRTEGRTIAVGKVTGLASSSGGA